MSNRSQKELNVEDLHSSNSDSTAPHLRNRNTEKSSLIKQFAVSRTRVCEFNALGYCVAFQNTPGKAYPYQY